MCVFCKQVSELLECAFHAVIQVINKDIKQHQSRYCPLNDATGHQLPAGLWLGR